MMQEILDKLSDEQRLCVLMYYDEMSVGEIAERLCGMPVPEQLKAA